MSLRLLMLAALAGAMMTTTTIVQAADLGAGSTVLSSSEANAAARRAALSNYVDLLLVRVTFSVLDETEVPFLLQQRLTAWGAGAPAPEEAADIARQVLAEGSYYLVSLRYTIEAGGAIFPDDRSDSVYAKDALVRLDGLERELVARLTSGGEATDLLLAAEAIRALTEGFDSVPPDEAIIGRHDELLQAALERAEGAT